MTGSWLLTQTKLLGAPFTNTTEGAAFYVEYLCVKSASTNSRPVLVCLRLFEMAHFFVFAQRSLCLRLMILHYQSHFLMKKFFVASTAFPSRGKTAETREDPFKQSSISRVFKIFTIWNSGRFLRPRSTLSCLTQGLLWVRSLRFPIRCLCWRHQVRSYFMLCRPAGSHRRRKSSSEWSGSFKTTFKKYSGTTSVFCTNSSFSTKTHFPRSGRLLKRGLDASFSIKIAFTAWSHGRAKYFSRHFYSFSLISSIPMWSTFLTRRCICWCWRVLNPTDGVCHGSQSLFTQTTCLFRYCG